MRRVFHLAAVAPLAFAAQSALCQAPPAAAPMILAADKQIAAAILPLPKEFRESATVMGYGADGKMTALRSTKGPFVCLASDPKSPRFHVACYHRSLEPFMARGRALRAQGVTGEKVDTVRFAEIKSGKLAMPKQAAALYSLSGAPGSYDAASGAVTGGHPLFVVYISGSTPESTGLSAQPIEGGPWIMYPGTPKAHIMLVPKM